LSDSNSIFTQIIKEFFDDERDKTSLEIIGSKF